jgi:hypothetical protein
MIKRYAKDRTFDNKLEYIKSTNFLLISHLLAILYSSRKNVNTLPIHVEITLVLVRSEKSRFIRFSPCAGSSVCAVSLDSTIVFIIKYHE